MVKRLDLLEVLKLISKNLINSEKKLTDLDSEIGDGDCGIGMKRGFETVLNLLETIDDEKEGVILKKVGFTLASTIGGTSGAILGTGFMELGKNLLNRDEISLKDWGEATLIALESMKKRGEGVKVGDKTLIDALEPAVNEFNKKINETNNIVEIFESAVASAKAGSESTKALQAKKGRASYLGERTIGKIDPGSVVITIIFDSVLEYFKNKK